MKNKFLKSVFVIAIAMIAGINVFKAQQPVQLSDIAMANVEALADNEDDENFFQCPDCKECTGTYYICESQIESFFEEARKNCSSLDIDLNVIFDC